MNRARRTSNLNNILTYDTLGNSTLIANLTVEGLTGAGFVKADAAGLLSVDTAAYTVVTGATNYLTKITGASTLGQSLVYDNGTSVLVNSTTGVPGYNHAFQVVANAAGGIVVSTTDVASGLGIVNSSSANKTWDISPYGNHLVINESGIATRIKFDAGGNITIGDIVNTGHKLEIVGSFRTTGTNTLSQLQGVGDRMVVANTNGVLSTQAIPTGSITGSGAAGQVNFWTGTNTVSGSNTFQFTPTSQLFVNNSVTAAIGNGTGTNLTPTIIASANNDVLVGLHVNPSFNNGALTGVTNIAARFTASRGFILLESSVNTNNTAIQLNAKTSTGVTVGAGFYNIPSGTNSNYFTISGDATATHFNIHRSGNVVLQASGTPPDNGQRLQVYGDTLLRGSGATSATTALAIQDSSSNNLFSFRNNGTLTIPVVASQSSPVISIFQRSGIINNNSYVPILKYGNTVDDQNQHAIMYGFWSSSNVSGFRFRHPDGSGGGGVTFSFIPLVNQIASNVVNIQQDFTPTSGGQTITQLLINPTINQTGGANGVTRGLLLTPTLTSAADWRSIEFSNNTGWGLYGAGTANNYLAGNLSVGTLTTTDWVNIGASTTTKAQIFLTAGVDPTTPTDGDIWATSTDIKARVAGTTYSLINSGLSGSGTAGQVTYWTGASAVSGSNNLFWDNANGRLGIGTNAPSRPLTINFNANDGNGLVYLNNPNTGASANAGLVLQATTASGSLFATGSGYTTIGVLQANRVGFYANASFAIAVQSGDFIVGTASTLTERMRLFGSTGNLSIGTASDLGTRLGVVGDTLLRGSGATSATTALTVQSSASTDLLTVRNDGFLFNRYAAQIGSGTNVANGANALTIVGYGSYAFNFNNSTGFTFPNVELTSSYLRLGGGGEKFIGNSSFTAGADLYLHAGWYSVTASYGKVSIGTAFNSSASRTLAVFDMQTMKANISGIIEAGSATSTNGSVILRGNYTSGYLTTLGTDASSGGPMLSYGIESAQNSTAGAFVSSSAITIPRSAYVQNGGHIWYTAPSSSTAIGTAVVPTKHMELYNSGNLVLGGGADDATNRLQIGGNAFIKGTGNTNATIALQVQNSDGTNLIRAGNNNVVTVTNLVVSNSGGTTLTMPGNNYFFHDSVGTQGRLVFFAQNTLKIGFGGSSNGITINPSSSAVNELSGEINVQARTLRNAAIYQASVACAISGANTAGTFTANGTVGFDPTNNHAGGHLIGLYVAETFNPNSTLRDVNYSAARLSPIINQSGGAVSETRGILVSPTLTAAADWRSIEWSNNTGWGLYGVGTAKNYLNGTTLIGTNTDDGVNKLQVTGSISATADSVINGVTIGKGGGSGALNTTVGNLALSANTTGASNTAFGLGALGTITTGSENVGVGTNAGRYRNGTTANSNSSGGVYIGFASRASAAATTNEIVIGSGAQGSGNNTVTIGNTGIVSTVLRGTVSTNGIIRSDASRTAAINDVSIALLGSNITTYAAGFTMAGAGYGLNAVYAQHEQRFGGNADFDSANLVGAGLMINKLAPTAAGTITMGQVGSGRTMSNLHLMTQFEGNNNLTVTHMSGLHIYGHYRTSGTGTITVSTAYYGILLADPNEFGAGATITGTNWGFYQAGAAPNNYFGGKVLIGTTTTTGTSKLRISGLPTSSAGLGAGEVWNDAGTLKIA